MVDYNKWFRCSTVKPKKKGRYLLQVGFRNSIGAWLEIYIIESKWNGKSWDIPGNAVGISWKFITPSDASRSTTLEKIMGNFNF